jgi:xanthine dehydrogenase iron-sulfur cluster and FAD-binding subunit A
MVRYTYIRALSTLHALALLNEPGASARVLAGGTDLLLLLRAESSLCDRVVDVSQVPELHRIEREAGWVTIGAATTFSEAMGSAVVWETATVLAQACQEVGAVQIRNMGTLGGNVANAAACADSLPALICLDARARVLTVREGSEAGALSQDDVLEHDWPVTETVTGPNRTRIPAGGLLVSLRYRVPEPGSRSVFLKLGRRNAMAISRLTVAALGRQDGDGRIIEARLVPGSATPQIRRFGAVEEMLVGQVPDEQLLAEAGRAAAAEMRALSGRRWSSEFKEPALASMVTQALGIVFSGHAVSSPARAGGVVTAGAPQDALRRSYSGEEPHQAVRGDSAAGARLPESQPADARGASVVKLHFTLNGRPVSVDAPPDISLLALLRDHLGVTGTKEGCGIGECGACSVILDGRVVNSCLTLAAQAGGREVTTIEGIRGPNGGPNDLQQAFIDYGAVQCGFCIPGMVLAGEALLAANAQPTRTEIRQAIAGNLCRCTGYQQIVDAIEATARKRKA